VRDGSVRKRHRGRVISAVRQSPRYAPMHPTLVREPLHRDGWVYEEKYNRWRIVLPIQSVFTLALTRNRGRPWRATPPAVRYPATWRPV